MISIRNILIILIFCLVILTPVYANIDNTKIPIMERTVNKYWNEASWINSNSWIYGNLAECGREYDSAFYANIMWMEKLTTDNLVTSSNPDVNEYEDLSNNYIKNELENMKEEIELYNTEKAIANDIYDDYESASNFKERDLFLDAIIGPQTVIADSMVDVIPKRTCTYQTTGEYRNGNRECHTDDDGDRHCHCEWGNWETRTITSNTKLEASGDCDFQWKESSIKREKVCNPDDIWTSITWTGRDSCVLMHYCEQGYFTPGGISILSLIGTGCQAHEDGNGFGGHMNGALNHATNTMLSAVNINNIITKSINEQINNLDLQGADYQNYNGNAKGAWGRVKTINNAIESLENTGQTISNNMYANNYANAYYKWNLILNSMKDKENSYGIVTAYHFASVMDSLANKDDSAIIGGIELYKQLVEANQSMHEEYETAKEDAEYSLEQLEDQLNIIENEKIELIEEEPPQNIDSVEYEESYDNIGISGTSIYSKYNNLYDKYQEIKENQNEADNLKNNDNAPDYLAKSIEHLNKVELDSDSMFAVGEALYQEAESYEDAAKDSAQNKINECESLIQRSSNTEKQLYARIYLTDAKNNYPSGSTTIGEKYLDYLQVYKNASTCVAIMNGQTDLPFITLDELLDRFDNTIKCVENQGYPDIAQPYRTKYNLYEKYTKGVSDMDAMDMGLPEEILGQIQELENQIENQYPEIIGLRTTAKNKINEMKTYGIEVSSEETKFESYEIYFTNNSLNMERAVCELQNIKQGYEQILDNLNSKSPDALNDILSSNSEVYINYDKTPTLDEKVNAEITVILNNPTDISSSSKTSVEIPFDFIVYKIDGVDLDSDVKDIYTDGDSLTIDFYRIDANKQYNLKFEKEGYFFTTTSVDDTITYQDDVKIEHQINLDFEAEIATDLVLDKQEIHEWTVTTSGILDGRHIETQMLSNKVKIYLDDVTKGSHSAVITYTIENRTNSLEHSQDAYYQERDNLENELDNINQTINDLRDAGMEDEANALQDQYNTAQGLLDDAKQQAKQGDYGQALDSLKEARETMETDPLEMVRDKKQDVIDRYAELSKIWSDLNVEDEQVDAIKKEVEKKLSKLSSSNLSLSDLDMIKDINGLLDMFENKINEYLSENDSEFTEQLNTFKQEVNTFEHDTVPSYRNYYKKLSNFKIGDSRMVVFPYTLTNMKKYIKEAKDHIEDIEEQNISTKTVSLLEQAKSQFETVKDKTINSLNGIDERTDNFISGSKKSLNVLKQRELNNEQQAKVQEMDNEIKNADKLKSEGKHPEAFMESAKTYNNLLMLLSTLNPEENGFDTVQMLIIGLSVIFIIIIGYVIYAGIKQQKPIETKKSTSKKDDKKTNKKLRRSTIRKIARRKKK